MNYSELKNIAKSKKILLKEIADSMNVSAEGLKYSIENNTLPINKLLELCKILNITPADFFGTTINGNGNIVGSNINKSTIDNRHYYSDSPDVLKAQIEVLEERIKEKDSQIKEKDSQIKEKDSQIKELLNILKNK
ncbi:MAG: hypothetical protein IJW01_00585 [Paludibacteraceae bacterium]|nr:hypothetical protein [Paludibacteraceae bacterium]